MGEREPDWTAVDKVLGDHEHAAALLKRYFAPLNWMSQDGFTGSWFERFDGGGDRHPVANHFTSADLTAVTMLSIDVPPRAGWLLTTDPDGHFSQLLSQISTTVALADVRSSDELSTCEELWREVRALPGIGRTTTSKLLARKRPQLVPVQDDITMAALGNPTVFWEPLRQRLRSGLHQQLLDLTVAAGTPASVGALRVLDIVLWMHHR